MDITMLKEYLGESLYAQAEERLAPVEGLRLIVTDDGSWLPKGRLDEEIAKRRELQGKLEDMTEEIEAAQATQAENAALRDKLAETEAQLEKARAEAAEMALRGSIREALARAGARDIALVEKLISGEIREEAEIEERVRELLRRSPYLFEDAAAAQRGGYGGIGAGSRRNADANGAIRAAAGRI